MVKEGVKMRPAMPYSSILMSSPACYKDGDEAGDTIGWANMH